MHVLDRVVLRMGNKNVCMLNCTVSKINLVCFSVVCLISSIILLRDLTDNKTCEKGNSKSIELNNRLLTGFRNYPINIRKLDAKLTNFIPFYFAMGLIFSNPATSMGWVFKHFKQAFSVVT